MTPKREQVKRCFLGDRSILSKTQVNDGSAASVVSRVVTFAPSNSGHRLHRSRWLPTI
ncbi:MAG TPA: hypothetical protein VKK81_17790 [Candidatus Binatia bacterium]|nr:hypothetical protein [Candidatus Binatia bacterium]